MLLGETPAETATSGTSEAPPPPQGKGNGSFEAGSLTAHSLDILHATSAALIHGLREVLLDSDFENAMKALTSWIPIKDEELLMRVTRAEWKQHRGRKKEKA